MLILKDASLFGAGAWSLPYLAPLKLNSGYEPMLGEGSASAHCDPLQFLSEFGLIGSGLIITMMTWPFIMVRRMHRSQPLLWACVSLGLLAILFYSFIDLPFRHPAILCAWFAIAILFGTQGKQEKERRSYV